MAYTSERQEISERIFDPANGGSSSINIDTGEGRLIYNTIEYPSPSSDGGLGSARYPHFAIFYININARAISEAINNAAVSMATDISGAVNYGVNKLKTFTGFGTPTKATVVTPSLYTQENVQTGAVLNKTAGTSLGQVTKEVFSRSNKRIKDVICLPMPQKVKANYAAGYSATESANLLTAVLAAPEGSLSTLTQNAIPTAAAAIVSGLSGGVAGKVLDKAGIDKAMLESTSKQVAQINSKLFGTVLNKRQEQIFESMEFRSHHLQWLFLPRSAEESKSIFTICQMFKENMHPDLDTGSGNSMLIMPAEFDIEFRYGDTENNRISKIATCVLKSAEIDYSAVGEFISFDGVSDPIAISLSLIFCELEPLNQVQVRLGF